MTPIAVWDAITADPALNGYGITAATVFEAQSLDGNTRPGVDGHFLVIHLLEQVSLLGGQHWGPRGLDIAAHVPAERTRDYRTINRILNRIDVVLTSLEQLTSSDGVRVTPIRPLGQSKNLPDPGWRTITRAAQHSMLCGESAA
ncbi:hypothetical protein MJO55_23610 [Mycolicibacterium rufum]|uniref:Uncharacterized protein n=1 Tax=Mycolicibacterium rufum TaxID=318424 RepID=A0A9X2Y8V6_9MYCO|nr:hypothetical protein [Mycolicibacterium rufum]KGI69921.1 hypothetical protein EU78_23540 [Mycolicibacterium rufum]MCV7069442.1 hypothetical protein [Mycolicibacterium rufum]ULP36173.1 hypothetical protein MJO55_23610 [Mycolicibacterium rufum]